MHCSTHLSGGRDNPRVTRRSGPAALVLTVLLAACGQRETVHNGKPLSQWLREAAENAVTYSEVRDAFLAFEGEAVPYLVREIRAGRRFAAVVSTNPASLWLLTPADKTLQTLGLQAKLSYPESRLLLAYDLLAQVADQQRQQAQLGVPSRKPSITNAFPVLREALALGNLRGPEVHGALQTLHAAGPLAAEFLPDLLNLVTNSSAADPFLANALRTLGGFGPPAIPYLLPVAADPRRHPPQRDAAAMALGEIGPPSRSAAPVIAALLEQALSNVSSNRYRSPVAQLTVALASLGHTPEQAVPHLEQLAASSNLMERVPALIALWNRQPTNAALRKQITANLSPTNPYPAVEILARLGTNAAVFAPQMRGLIQHPHPVIRFQVARFLRALEPAGR